VRLGSILFVAHFIILALCFSYPITLLAQRVRIGYLESAEEPLVDAANILAEFVGRQAGETGLDTEELYRTFAAINQRKLSAKIYELQKEHVDLDVYITDRAGKIVFDSRGRENLGADYSRWLDVSRTLKGEYGARIGRLSEEDDLSSPAVLYVAAPVLSGNEIVGALTVVKPTSNAYAFLSTTKSQLFGIGAGAVALAGLLSLLLSLWVTQQVQRLTRYADAVRGGQRVPFPRLAKTELLDMGQAFERMRASLAGQAYIEQYVQTLTHEIKSPISAIRGASEILESAQLDDEKRAHFLRNIHNETQRIQDLVERMLKLSELEVQRALPESKLAELRPIVDTVVEGKEPLLKQKSLRLELSVPDGLQVTVDPFLLHLALSNLLQNAIEFSPEGSRVRIVATRKGDSVGIAVEDQGPGIPEFARARIFERFFSLERLDTGRKSTGLGLNLVKEIAELHHGSASVENLPGAGLRATLRIRG
jgi:two-component system sensor histidine kinase CreC